MQRLTVLYDADCAPCRGAAAWLRAQRQLVPLELVPASSPLASQRFPTLDPRDTLAELTVVSDAGEVWRGPKAWVVCLWALADHRDRAYDLASPVMWPMARRFIDWISHRSPLGRVLPSSQT